MDFAAVANGVKDWFSWISANAGGAGELAAIFSAAAAVVSAWFSGKANRYAQEVWKATEEAARHQMVSRIMELRVELVWLNRQALSLADTWKKVLLALARYSKTDQSDWYSAAERQVMERTKAHTELKEIWEPLTSNEEEAKLETLLGEELEKQLRDVRKSRILIINSVQFMERNVAQVESQLQPFYERVVAERPSPINTADRDD